MKKYTFSLIFMFIVLSHITSYTLFQFFHPFCTLWVTFASNREITDQPNASTFNYTTTHQTAKLVNAVAMRQHQIGMSSSTMLTIRLVVYFHHWLPLFKVSQACSSRSAEEHWTLSRESPSSNPLCCSFEIGAIWFSPRCSSSVSSKKSVSVNLQ